jgi:hypothetical protein
MLSGAGHARGEYETERDEQARRFRAKYGSNFVGADVDKDRSNAAAYFVRVFDTVAALGASSVRRFLIEAGLTLLFAGAASAAFAALAIVPSLIINYYFNFGFWWTELAISTTMVLLSVYWFYTASLRNTRRRSTISRTSIRPDGSAYRPC